MHQKNTVWEPMHEHVSCAQECGNKKWHITYIRDFIFSLDAPPVYRWSEKIIDTSQISTAYFYMFPLEQFGKVGRVFAHTCVGFSFKDGTDVLYSIEARQPQGKDYRPNNRAENVRMFATLDYFRGFRHVVRKRGFFRYPILLSQEKFSAILEACLRDSKNAYDTSTRYHPITNQCTTELIRAINPVLEKPIPWHPGWHITGLMSHTLAARGIINLKDREAL